MCKFCQEGICTNRCPVRKQKGDNVEQARQLKLNGLEYAQTLGLTIEQYQEYYNTWEDAVIGCGKKPKLGLLVELKESIDFQLSMGL